jgi:hypothetical protein
VKNEGETMADLIINKIIELDLFTCGFRSFAGHFWTNPEPFFFAALQSVFHYIIL